MTALLYSILTVYCICLLAVTVYCLLQLYLLYSYLRKREHTPDFSENVERDYPLVTIQLPLYNEPHVAARLIESASAIEYPRDKLQIQVLDDSNDETTSIVAAKVRAVRESGINITHLRREHRAGFKAGALDHGMLQVNGEFIAIFDADFIPRPDFLSKTLCAFDSPDIAVVQARWEHINERHSYLTMLQAFQLNVHFTIEQSGRHAAQLPLQFNGTAGIWRREAITDAGGWQADTLTEDLDLSYRAQLKGWRIIYLEEIGAPAELPVFMPAFKSQQYRWMKGGAETARKILPGIWRSQLPFISKVMASHHLLGSSIFLCVFLLGILSVPVMLGAPIIGINMKIFSFCLVGLLITSSLCFIGNTRSSWKRLPLVSGTLRFILYLPGYLALSMGLSLQNSIAVVKGLSGVKSPFLRTLKTGSSILQQPAKHAMRIPVTTYFEGLLSIYFFVAVIYGLSMADPGLVLFHVLLMLGYGCACYFTIRHLPLTTES